MSDRYRSGTRIVSRAHYDRSNVAVVIPALNEALRIRDVVTAALAQCPRVIVVDDGSTDGTAERIADLPVRLLRHPRRLGKGAALRSGFRAALADGAQGVLTMDGDGQHDAADLPRLLDAANRHPGRIVIGARLRQRARQPLPRRMANAFGDWGISWAAGHPITDTQSGQRFYPAEVAALDTVPGEDFVFEAQILISAARALGARCVAVPIESRYAPADGGRFRRSHFRPLRDLYRIATHVAAQVWAQERMLDAYRRVRTCTPLVHDPDGEFAPARTALPARPAASSS